MFYEDFLGRLCDDCPMTTDAYLFSQDFIQENFAKQEGVAGAVRRVNYFSLGVFLILGQTLSGGAADKALLLPNGWSISPAGQPIELGGMP